MRCRSNSEDIHENEHHRQHQRDGERDDDPRAGAERGEADEQDDNQRLDEGTGEFADGLFDDLGLIGDLVDLYAYRRLRAYLIDCQFKILAEGEDIAPLGHHNADDDRRHPVFPRQKGRRVFKPGRDRGDVAETENLTVHRDGKRRDRLGALQRTCDLQSYPGGRGFKDAGVGDRVLLGDRIKNRLWRNAQIGEFRLAEFDENLAVLIGVDIHFDGVGRLQEALAQDFDDGVRAGGSRRPPR